jgi:hypothetical protein
MPIALYLLGRGATEEGPTGSEEGRDDLVHSSG